MASTIRIEDDSKERFDKVQVQVTAKLQRMATQDDTIKELLDLWEQQEAGVQP